MHISYVAIGDRVRLCEREKDRAEKLEGRYFSSRGKHKNERCLGGEEIKKIEILPEVERKELELNTRDGRNWLRAVEKRDDKLVEN